MSSDEIKKSMKILNEDQQVNEVLGLSNELGFLRTLGTVAASLFSEVALGNLQAKEAASKLQKNYRMYVGKTGKKIGDTTIGDLYKFLSGQGIENTAVLRGMTRGLGVNLSSVNDVVTYKNTVIKTPTKLAMAFLEVTREQAKKGDEAQDPEDFAANIEKNKAGIVKVSGGATGAAKPVAAKVDLKDLIRKSLEGQDTKTQVANLNRAIKALAGTVKESQLDEVDWKGLAGKAVDWVKKFGAKEPAAAPEKVEPTVSAQAPDFATVIQDLSAQYGNKAVVNALVAYKKQLEAGADPFEKYKSELRQLAGIKGTKTIPPKFIDALRGDLVKLTKGDKESGTFAANKIIKFAKAGYNMEKPIDAWLNAAKAGERFLTMTEYHELSEVLQEYGLTWADVGIVTRLDETISDLVFISLATEV